MKNICLPKAKVIVLLLFIGLSSFKSFAQVGIGTIDPKTTLDINGAISLREGSAITLSNGANNNISLGNNPFSFYRITGSGTAFSITGLQPSTDSDGQIVTLENTTTRTMTIVHNATSTASNRIFCPGAKSFSLVGQYSTVTFQYNKSQSRWIVIGRNNTEEEPSIESVSLEENYTKSTNYFSDVPDMSLEFVARKSSVLVMLTGSGNSYDLDAGIADFRVVNANGGAVLGGTHEKLTSFDIYYGVVIPAWNISFTKLFTGLTVGNTYKLKVQVLVDIDDGGFYRRLQIYPVSNPSDHHLTLSVMQ